MAIKGKDNVIELARSYAAPYWKIYESEHKRTAGNFVAVADFDNPNLALDYSLDKLRMDLNRLTPGRYLFVSFKNNSSTKGMMDSIIEIEGSENSSSAISGMGSPEIYMDGIGKVTADNIAAVIDAKIEKVRQEDKKAAEDAAIRREIAELKKQLSDNESGFQRGVISIGSVLYDVMKDTESGKKVMGLASKVYMATRDTTTVAGTGLTPSGDGGGNEEDRITAALEKLGTNNPDFVGQLEKLANLKETDPSTFEMAVSSLG